MSEKIVVPSGMLKAAAEVGARPESDWKQVLEAALRWLGENPPNLSVEMRDKICSEFKSHGWTGQYEYDSFMAREFVRRMFLQAEPEIPEAVQELLDVDWQRMHKALYRESIIEAFRRGQRSKQP